MGDTGWQFDEAPGDNLEVGGTYVCRATFEDGRFWGKIVITVTSKEPADDGDVMYGFTLDTILDGSPGLVDGFDGGQHDGP